MEALLTQLRATAEPTRLRLLALCAQGALCVSDLCEVLGQSQPRLSRHLKLLVEAGLLERVPEGANAYFQLPAGPGADLVRALIARLPDDAPLLLADRRAAVRLAAERARSASAAFHRDGADWDEGRALGLDTTAIEAAVLLALPARIERLLDLGTGTGRLLELAAPRCGRALGIDASRDMLALARARLAERGIVHASVRQADLYRVPLADAGFDVVALQMVLHYVDDPAAALAEAARLARPDGIVLVTDLAAHTRADVIERHRHRWPGFDDAAIAGWLGAAGCALADSVRVSGPLDVCVWAGRRRPDAARPALADEKVVF